MKIENDKHIITGRHNETSFSVEDGVLKMFGYYWDEDMVRTLLETVNLLRLEGVTIKKRMNQGITQKESTRLWKWFQTGTFPEDISADEEEGK